MKKNIFFQILSIILLSVCGIFFSCQNEELNDGVATYVGKVVYIGTDKPFQNLEVRITNGDKIHSMVHTDQEGGYRVSANVLEVDGSYYILVGDSSCVQKKMEIPSFAKKEVNMPIVEIEGPSKPTLNPVNISNIAHKSVVLSSEVISDGHSKVVARGFCYSTTENLTVTGPHKQCGSGLGEFSTTIDDLSADTKYYVCAYATNTQGTAYGKVVSFQSTNGLPVVTTGTVESITAQSAVCTGIVELNGGSPITACGVCWSTTSNMPLVTDKHTTESPKAGAMTCVVSGLTPNTTYYLRAYATNDNGTTYGDTRTFTTSDGLPVVKTGSVDNIAPESASAVASVESDGGSKIMTCGVCWSTTNNMPLVTDNHTTEIPRVGTMNCVVTGLTPNTSYYLRAYATNEFGTAYGETITFNTPTGLPVLGAGSMSEIKSTSAEYIGSLVTNGGANITEYGLCWSSDTSTPDVEKDQSMVVFVTGTKIQGTIISLAANTTYYVRAYAKNKFGIGYSEAISFKTLDGKPVLETLDPGDNVSASSVTAIGNIISNGESPITECGFVYSTIPYPTHQNATAVLAEVVNSGYFSVTISGIDPGHEVYYIRAFATNANGTTYGEQIVTNPERIAYLSLPVVEYGGYRYHVYPDVAPMSQSAAVRFCKDMVYAGYDDWFLPNGSELQAIMEANIGGWKNSGDYWSSDVYYYYYIDGYGTVKHLYDSYSTTQCRVRPVRKDKL